MITFKHSTHRVVKEVLPAVQHKTFKRSVKYYKNILLRTIYDISSDAGTSLKHVFHAGNKNVPNASSNAEFVIIYHCAVNIEPKESFM